jgi:hypothetical protein
LPQDQPGKQVTSPQDVPEEVDAEKPMMPSSLPETESRLKSVFSKNLLWILLPITGLLALFGVFLFMARRKANQWKQWVGSHLKHGQQQKSGVLVAKLNGQSHRLGQFERFRVAHLGREKSNAIRSSDKSIENRHLKIYRKGNDLWLKNLAKSPVMANGMEIKPKRSYRLVLPSVINLNERTKLNLVLEQSQVISQEKVEQGKNDNETN